MMSHSKLCTVENRRKDEDDHVGGKLIWDGFIDTHKISRVVVGAAVNSCG